MSLVLEIAEDEVLAKMSDDSKDPAFNEAIKKAKETKATNGSDFMAQFSKSYKEIAPNGKLSAIFAALPKYNKLLNYNSTNDEVIAVLSAQMKKSVDETFQVLKTRIDQFGVASPNITLQSNTGRIILELPGVEDPSRIRRILQQTAQLEFWNTYENEELIQNLIDADKALGAKMETEKDGKDSIAGKKDSTSISTNELLGTATADSMKGKATAAKKDSSKMNPLLRILYPRVDNQNGVYPGPSIGVAFGKDTAKVNEYLVYGCGKMNFPERCEVPVGR